MRPNAALICALLMCALGCTPDPEHRRDGAITPARSVVVDNLKSPWGIAFLNANRALITEKDGGIVIADLISGQTTPVTPMPADLIDDIRVSSPGDNGGMFDIALDPNFEGEPWVYLSYAAKSGPGRTTKIVRARLVEDTLQDYQTLFVASPFTENEFFHYGGGIAFGPDGKLYVTVGERLFSEINQPALPIAQDYADKRGKIYRLNPDGTPPMDNPDFGPQAPPGLYAVGIRAAQGLTVHPQTGDLWFSEHGTRQGDEINRLQPGANYGWPVKTTGGYRDTSYEPPLLQDRTFTPPIWYWAQTVAPTGLAFYDGDEFPHWRGDLLVSGLSRGNLLRLNFEQGQIVSMEELFVHDRIRSRKVALGPDGRLYQLTDTLFKTGSNGALEFTGQPGGQLLRIHPKR